MSVFAQSLTTHDTWIRKVSFSSVDLDGWPSTSIINDKTKQLTFSLTDCTIKSLRSSSFLIIKSKDGYANKRMQMKCRFLTVEEWKLSLIYEILKYYSIENFYPYGLSKQDDGQSRIDTK